MGIILTLSTLQPGGEPAAEGRERLDSSHRASARAGRQRSNLWITFGFTCSPKLRQSSLYQYTGIDSPKSPPHRPPSCRGFLLLGTSKSIKMIKRRPKGFQERSRALFFGSKSLQERSKRLSRGFSRASTSKMRLGTTLGPVLKPFVEAADPPN